MSSVKVITYHENCEHFVHFALRSPFHTPVIVLRQYGDGGKCHREDTAWRTSANSREGDVSDKASHASARR